MRRYVFIIGCALVLTAPLAAQQTLSDSTVHVVRSGDTLWDLARRYLQNPYLWREIYRLNQDVVSNPHWIYPSERLRIPGLVVQPDAVAIAREAGLAERTAFFPQEDSRPQSRIEQIEAAVVPVVRPGDFYRAGFLVREEEMTPVGELAEVVSPSVVPLETSRAIHRYDRVFTKVLAPGRVSVGDRLQLVRRDRAVEGFGRIFVSTGLATVTALQGEVATIVIDQMHADIRPGDWAIPAASFPVTPGVTPQPAGGLNGEILAFQSPHGLHSVEDLAFVNLGQESGVKEGDEFQVILPPVRASWGTRPEVEVARLQVVRVSRRTAAVRVVGMQQPALEPGLSVRLVEKMP